MSASIPSVTIRTSLETPSRLVGPGQVTPLDEKQSVTQRLALSAMVQKDAGEIARRLGEKQENVDALIHGVMRLQPPAKNPKIKVDLDRYGIPQVQLNLSPSRQKLQDTILESWALYNRLSWPEVWGLDVFHHLQQLLPHLRQEARELVMQTFCSDFMFGYVSLTAEYRVHRYPKETPKIHFFYKDAPKDTFKGKFCIMISRKEWILRMQEFQAGLLPFLLNKKDKTAITCLMKVLDRISFGSELLQHPQALTFLCDLNLSYLEEQFPKASSLCNASPEKTLKDLLKYCEFILKGFSDGVATQKLSILPTAAQGLIKLVKALEKEQNTPAAAKKLKQFLALSFRIVAIDLLKLSEDFEAARQGTLTHEAFCKREGITNIRGKNQEDFAVSLFYKHNQTAFLNGFLHDVIDILDEQILASLYPNDFVCTLTAMKRITLNLDFYLKREARGIAPFLSLTVAAAAGPHLGLSSTQQSDLDALLTTMRKDLHTLFPQSTLTLEDLIQANQQFTTLSERPRFYFNLWIPFLEQFAELINIMNSRIPQLEETRQTHLKLIEGFLKTLDPKQLQVERQQWTLFFGDLGFKGGLDFCRISMLAKDLEAVLKMSVDSDAITSEAHLLAPELVEYMDLDVSEIIDTLLASALPKAPVEIRTEHKSDATPVATAAAQETPSKPIASLLSRPQAPMIEDVVGRPVKTPLAALQRVFPSFTVPVRVIAPTPVAAAPSTEERFKIRRGEKMRKILTRLKDEGHIPRNEMRGSHAKLKTKENKEGSRNKPFSLPIHGGGSQLKPGLARALRKHVNSADKS